MTKRCGKTLAKSLLTLAVLLGSLGSYAGCPELTPEAQARLQDVASARELYGLLAGRFDSASRMRIVDALSSDGLGESVDPVGIEIRPVYPRLANELACLAHELGQGAFGGWFWAVGESADGPADFPDFLIDAVVHHFDSPSAFESAFLHYSIQVTMRGAYAAAFDRQPIPGCEGRCEEVGRVYLREAPGPAFFDFSVRTVPLRRCLKDGSLWRFDLTQRGWLPMTSHDIDVLSRSADPDTSPMSPDQIRKLLPDSH